MKDSRSQRLYKYKVQKIDVKRNKTGRDTMKDRIKHNVKNGLGTFTGYCVGSEIDVYIDK